jgi:hypothetical protein
MSKLLLAIAAGWLTLWAPAASAAVLVHRPGNYAEMVHNGHQPDGLVVWLASQGGYAVEFAADGVIDVNGGGFARQDGPSSFLEIDPLDVGFSRIGLTVRPDLAFAGLRGHPAVTFDVTVSFLGGLAPQVLRGTLPRNGKIDVWGEEGEVLDSIRLSNLSAVGDAETPLRFDGVRHVSFEAAPAPLVQPLWLSQLAIAPIPEPSSWALMLTGFFTLGGILRWQRRARPAG